MTESRGTQRSKILELLIAARGDWVPLPQIMQCAAQYNTRIHELRRMGFRILPPRTKTVAGRKHTWYRIELAEKPTQTASRDVRKCPTLSPIAISTPSTFPEFGSLAPESYGVD